MTSQYFLTLAKIVIFGPELSGGELLHKDSFGVQNRVKIIFHDVKPVNVYYY